MGRPSIRDLASAAGVSVATVNRVLAGTGTVREATMQAVVEAAKKIGFYGLGALQQRSAPAGVQHRLGVIVQTPHRQFCNALTTQLEAAAAEVVNADVRLQAEHIDDLSPDSIATRMLALGKESHALAVVAADHPLVTDAIDQLADLGVPVIALDSPLAARSPVGYVGLDSWKVGRMSAWAFEHMSKAPGKLGILIGTHRYRSHDLAESGFRSYFREHASDLSLLEPQSTFESDAIARELTETMLRTHPDLQGLYVSGGGIGGALAAIRASGRSGQVVTVGYDLLETTRAGLLDGSLTLVISHPFRTFGRETIAALIRAKGATTSGAAANTVIPFEIYTRENL